MKRPIIIPKNNKKSKKKDRYTPPVFVDERADLDFLFERKYGKFIKKPKDLEAALPPLAPEFQIAFDYKKDTKIFDKLLKFEAEVPTDVRTKIRDLVIKYWCCFREEGLAILVHGYGMIIDIGAAPPVNCKKVHYGIHQSPIMQKTIDNLLANGLIIQDSDSSWNSNIVLAPKPHQEDVTDIDEYIWRFCISYVTLNLVIKVINYTIPRCDDAATYGFGRAKFFIIMDAFSGYHQIKMALCSIDKIAFSGPHGRKYKWVAMPFGLRNSAATFVCMVHDLKAIWDAILAEKMDLKHNGTRIIIDDLIIFAESFENAVIILETILTVAKHYNLTWKLKKCHFFDKKIEFVGIDVSNKGNQPAASKTPTLTTWKHPQTIRDVAGFLGFVGFYSKWIPNFELKALPLRKLVREYNYPDKILPTMWIQTEEDTFQYLKESVLKKPILQRANPDKRFYLKTDFSSIGMGFSLCQPGDDEDSIQAMQAEDAGSKCKFDLCLSKLRLHPVCFGSRKRVNNEVFFHSYVGEATAAAWAIVKNRHFLWAKPFTLLTDCHALAWLMNYTGTNAAIRRLILEMAGYWFTIEHRNNNMMQDPDYWSRLGHDCDIDPLTKEYMFDFKDLWKNHTPTQGEINKSNTPGRRKTDVSEQKQQPQCNLVTIQETSITNVEYQNIPVMYSTQSQDNTYVLNNSQIVQNHHEATIYNWIVYGFTSGHFINTIKTCLLPFKIILCADPNPAGRNQFAANGIENIYKSLRELHSTVSHSDTTVDAIYISCPDLTIAEHQSRFLHECTSLFTTCNKNNNVKIIILEYNTLFDLENIKSPKQSFEKKIQVDYQPNISTVHTI